MMNPDQKGTLWVIATLSVAMPPEMLIVGDPVFRSSVDVPTE